MAEDGSVKLCGFGSSSCTPLSRAEYGAAVSLWIVLPLVAALIYAFLKHRRGSREEVLPRPPPPRATPSAQQAVVERAPRSRTSTPSHQGVPEERAAGAAAEQVLGDDSEQELDDFWTW